jgi:hypothetical protein
LSEDDIPETSNVKCTGRFEGTGVDVVDVVETVSFWDSSFFVVAGSRYFADLTLCFSLFSCFNHVAFLTKPTSLERLFSAL